MAPFITPVRTTAHSIPQSTPLSGTASDWPAEAQQSYRDVLSELDAWCRQHDASRALNSWVAEEAVRQVW